MGVNLCASTIDPNGEINPRNGKLPDRLTRYNLTCDNGRIPNGEYIQSLHEEHQATKHCANNHEDHLGGCNHAEAQADINSHLIHSFSGSCMNAAMRCNSRPAAPPSSTRWSKLNVR